MMKLSTPLLPAGSAAMSVPVAAGASALAQTPGSASRHESVIDIDRASVRYGRHCALDGLTLRLEAGEVLGLLGHNGAGKTTTMKLILGLLAPQAGQVRVFGEDPHGPAAPRLRLALGYLPENVSFYDNLSGREVLDFFARLKRAPRAQATELLERVGLAAAAGRRVKTYSKGMRQRLGLAQALLGSPRLLLLDEPTVGLDPLATREFYARVDELRRTGTTIILCSHVLPGVERHIDRALILGQGRVLAAGSLDALREQAGLPLLIHVRGSPGPHALAALPAGSRTRMLADGRFEIALAVHAKLDALRGLLTDPAVHDLDIEPPSLETLYAHFGSAVAGEGESA